MRVIIVTNSHRNMCSVCNISKLIQITIRKTQLLFLKSLLLLCGNGAVHDHHFNLATWMECIMHDFVGRRRMFQKEVLRCTYHGDNPTMRCIVVHVFRVLTLIVTRCFCTSTATFLAGHRNDVGIRQPICHSNIVICQREIVEGDLVHSETSLHSCFEMMSHVLYWSFRCRGAKSGL